MSLRPRSARPGRGTLLTNLRKFGHVKDTRLNTLADAALAAAQAQQIRMLGEAVAAGLIRDIAAGPPARERLSARQAHRGGPGPPP
jgi:hypothetical protein